MMQAFHSAKLRYGKEHASPRCRRRVEALVLLDAGLPLLQFLGRLPLVAAEFGDQRDRPGVDTGTSRSALLPL